MEKIDIQIINGRSQNQALEVIKPILEGVTISERVAEMKNPAMIEGYKELTRIFTKANIELYRESMNDFTNAVPAIPVKKEEVKKAVTELKSQSKEWTKCPKCQGWIKPEWKSHIKCGWIKE